jgi:hypothetical protein
VARAPKESVVVMPEICCGRDTGAPDRRSSAALQRTAVLGAPMRAGGGFGGGMGGGPIGVAMGGFRPEFTPAAIIARIDSALPNPGG